MAEFHDRDDQGLFSPAGPSSLGKNEDTVHASGDVGIMVLAVRQDTATALAGTSGDYAPVEVDATGHLHVAEKALVKVSSATLSSLASSASSAQLIASNTSRRGLLLFNTDENAVYVKYGTTASATDFTVKIPASGYWEMPQPIYTGRLDAIWAANGAGQLNYTEL